jgi:hypothetical protein
MSDAFMILAFVGLVIVALAPRKYLRVGRAIYWAGTLVVCTSVFFMAFPPNWRSGLSMALCAGCAITAVAYVNTPFIKIRGRTYAFYSHYRLADGSRDGSNPPHEEALANHTSEPYDGGVSVKKSWWRAAFVMAIFAFGVFAYFANQDTAWLAVFAAAVIILAGAFFGHRDATLDQPIAAGQRVQFGLISAMTLGAFTVSTSRRTSGVSAWAQSAERTGAIRDEVAAQAR